MKLMLLEEREAKIRLLDLLLKRNTKPTPNEMDGFGTNDHVIVLAATNRADILDRALIRAVDLTDKYMSIYQS